MIEKRLMYFGSFFMVVVIMMSCFGYIEKMESGMDIKMNEKRIARTLYTERINRENKLFNTGRLKRIYHQKKPFKTKKGRVAPDTW